MIISVFIDWNQNTVTYSIFLNFNYQIPTSINHNLITWTLASDQTLICHTTMCRNAINLLYIPGHVTRWCLEAIPVVFASDVIPWNNTNKLAWDDIWLIHKISIFADGSAPSPVSYNGEPLRGHHESLKYQFAS